MAEDDRPLDPERVAERADVVGACLEGPRGGIAPRRTTVAAQVEVDDLHPRREPGEPGLEVRVVEAARPTVDQDQRRPFDHRSAAWYER